MNEEIELKFKVAEQTAQEILAKYSFSEPKRTVDTYYQMDNPNHYLRIREVGDKCSLEYYEFVDEYLTKEWECGVDSAVIMKDILEKLNYKLDVVVDKGRQKAKKNEVEIVLDSIKDLGMFIELEGQNRASVDSLVTELGLDRDSQVKGAGYPDLLRDLQT